MTFATGSSSEARPRAAVLLVGDRPAELLALEAMLEPLGVDFVRATSGNAALEAARAKEMAAILLDVRRPGTVGQEAASHLRNDERTRSMPILFVSACDDELRGHDLTGVFDYVSTPLDPRLVRTKVGALVKLWERDERLRRRERELSERERALAMAEAREARAAADARASILESRIESAPMAEQAHARRRIESLVLAHSESEARYRTLFESAAVSLWEQDFSATLRVIEELRAKGITHISAYFAAHPEELYRAVAAARVNDVNAETLRLLGARSKQELFDSFEDILLPETREAFARQLDAFARGETDVTTETALRRLDGERVDVVVRLRVPERGDAFDRVPVSIIDITSRKRVERALELLAQAGVVLAESVDVGQTLKQVAQLAVPTMADWMSISLRNEKGGVELVASAHVDPRAEPLIHEHFRKGLGRETSVCGHARALREGTTQLTSELSPDDWARAAVDEAHLRIIERLEPRSHLTVPFTDERGVAGTIKLVYSRPGRRYDEDERALAEELARRISVALERQRLFARAERDRERAESANRAKDLFLSTLSHELRNPLNSILGWAQMLRMGEVEPDRLAHALEVIERNAQTQAALVDDILDLSRITSGKMRLEITEVDLVQVVEGALEAMRTAAAAKRIALEVRVENTLLLAGDSTRLQQVVWNLLSNAVKFTPPGGRIEVELKRLPSSAEITVTDTGVGIAAEFVDQVFDTFRQEDASATRRHGGLGLGLAIAKHIVELHGGTIRVSSEGLGKGASFTVSLPTSVELRATPLPFSVVETPTGATTFRPPSILRGRAFLVVEDEDDAREMLASMLRSCGGLVTCVGSVREALAKLEERKVDLVLSDISMPGEDGYSLIRKIRALPDETLRRVPAVALTAYASRADRTRALAEGFSAHVAKPVDVDELASVLASVLARRR